MPKIKKIERIISLFHYSWSLPLMAELHRASGAKFVTLVHRLRISRDALRRTLAAHIDAGWLKRNPGYGHPLRPEYVLSSYGRRLGSVGAKFIEKIRECSVEEVALRKWSMPILFVMCDRPCRFSDFKELLPGITPRALTQALRDLHFAELLERAVQETYPPTVSYRLSPKSRELCRLLRELSEEL